MKLSKFWITIIAIVGGLAIVTVVLGVIPLRNAPDLTSSADLSWVKVYTGGAEKVQLVNGDAVRKADYDKITGAYADAGRFTVLRGLLIGKLGGMLLTPDEDGERYDFDAVDALSSDASTYMLVFRYSKLQTAKVKGQEFSYNEAKVLVTDTDGEIGEFTVALYDTNQRYTPPPNESGNERYEIRYIKAKGKNFKLFDAVDEVVSA